VLRSLILQLQMNRGKEVNPTPIRQLQARPKMKNKLRLFLFYLISYGLCGPAVSGFAQDVSFSSPMNFAAGDGPNSVAVGDFNRDGNEDLAIANANSNTVSILLGNGDGALVRPFLSP
jgi:FG-GAP repeat protein